MELKGEHNADNAALAYQAALTLGVAPETAHQVIATFSGLPHRQEILGEKDGVTYINDTTSTTPIATITAIRTHSDKPIVLILGGNAKQLPTSDLIEALSNIKHIVLLKGSLTDEILPQLQQKYPEKLSAVFDSLEPAVSYATLKAKMLGSATYVLFSPGATSFAMYNNEFHRGAHFSEIVKKLFES
jgi:UDP-N-acetylmuramoylalanine--D-glutamate ligase